jgi:hypothetical protein
VVLGQPLAQAVQSFGDRLARKARERLRAGIDLDAGNHVVLAQVRGKRHARLGLLPDGLVVQDHPADEFARAGGREQHLAIRAPVLFGRIELDAVEALENGARALVGGQKASMFRDHRMRGGG